MQSCQAHFLYTMAWRCIQFIPSSYQYIWLDSCPLSLLLSTSWTTHLKISQDAYLLQFLSIFVSFQLFYNIAKPYFSWESRRWVVEKYLEAAVEKSTRGDLDCYAVEDIGTDCIRKGTTTYAASDFTSSSSSVVIKNCGGWTLGTVWDVYMYYEKAGDHYLGRILTGLPRLSSHFWNVRAILLNTWFI